MYTSKGHSAGVDWDKEYWPTLNIKRFQNHPKPDEKILEHFVETLTNETNRVKSKYNVLESVNYAAGTVNDKDDNRVMDIYYKDKKHDTPICVFIHGGYWRFFDRTSSGAFVAPYVEKGYRVIIMDYNLCPKVTLAQLMEQTIEFFHWLFKYAQDTNAQKIELIGHSAGSHLLSLILTERIPPSSFTVPITNIYLIGGVYDLRELYKIESVNPNNIFSLNEKGSEDASPLLWKLETPLVEHLNRNNTKIHVLVGEYEADTFRNQSCAFAKKLTAAGLKTTFKIIDNYDHFDIIEDVPTVDTVINKYLMNNLK